MEHYEVIAEELSRLGETIRSLEERLAEVERVNTRLEDAALITARSLGEIASHWAAVYEAMRPAETTDPETSPVRDHPAESARRRSGALPTDPDR